MGYHTNALLHHDFICGNMHPNTSAGLVNGHHHKSLRCE